MLTGKDDGGRRDSQRKAADRLQISAQIASKRAANEHAEKKSQLNAAGRLFSLRFFASVNKLNEGGRLFAPEI